MPTGYCERPIEYIYLRKVFMDVNRICVLFTRGDSGLYTVKPTLQEARFSRGMVWILRKLIDKKVKSKGRGFVGFESKLLGRVLYNETWKGKRKEWLHEVVFTGEQNLEHNELRHVLELAIFRITGMYTIMQVSFMNDRAVWTLADGSGMREHVQRKIVTEGDEALKGVIDLSRVVTRDIKLGD